LVRDARLDGLEQPLVRVLGHRSTRNLDGLAVVDERAPSATTSQQLG
jgi:hypothetical protein